MAQAIRAILLASAMAATFVGRRANNALSQGLGAMDLGVADNGERTGHKQAARKLKALSFVIDGEAMWLDLMANLDLNQRTDLDRIPTM